ncbi:MAG: IcmT/TraK family protein [Alphaproteobacteria bacterium]|nr:IcmT/TraK family protein [Alphaproteobacteria bacterium]
MKRPGTIAWRDTARMPALWGLDVRVLVILLLPLMLPFWRSEALILCGVFAVFFIVAALRFGLSPDDAVRRLRTLLAGRRRALLPVHRPVIFIWPGGRP